MSRIAINGLGRIGQTFLKLAFEHPALEVVAVNDISDSDSLACLIFLDTQSRLEHHGVRDHRVVARIAELKKQRWRLAHHSALPRGGRDVFR